MFELLKEKNTALLLYMNYFLKNRKHYVEHVVKLLRIMILLMYWIFYMPFYESFISILNCHNGVHYLDKSLTCFQGIHIFYFVLCIIFLILLFSINIIIAMLYNETQPVQEDSLSRLESSFEVALVIYRSIVATFSNFCGSEVCSWVLISIFIISSALLCFQYYKQIPYYNSFVSVFCGSLIFNYFWISVNALLMKLLEVNGHIIIIFVGIPLITLLVKSLREKRIESLMKTNIDKLKLDIDSLIQVHNMTDFSKGLHKDQAQRMTMIGIVNIHILECQNQECPCKDEYELFDVATSQFSERNRLAPHQDEVFLNHFIKRLYEDALNKFINSPSIHIAFAYYLFKVMKNIHASLVELNIAIKKKPSLQQQFTIFRYRNIIEDYIVNDHLEHKYVYPELTNVIEFERLFGEMQKGIEKVCNLQVEFWTHLTTVVPDLNILNDLGKKLYAASSEADYFWTQLCKINSNYQQALNIYGEYLKEIRNHEHLGNTYIERAFNTMNAKKSIDEHAKTSDVLFSDDTTVLHVSGNKESIGKILKTSQGLSKVFGYSKTEVIGHSVNILMPTLFAKRHIEFMERFFRTGRQIIFYQERTLFATHRNGHCFQMKILVKQMPSLAEGIQYVGMIKPVASDYDYMLTDLDGVIDSFSKGITGLLGLTPNLFKDKDSQINIQLLAPDLISFFLETQAKGRAAKTKYRDAGGDILSLVVPRDFHSIAKSEAKSNNRAGSRSRGGRSQSTNNRNRSPIFKQFLKCLSKPKRLSKDRMPTAKQLLLQPEYVNCERKKDVQCEITCLDIKASTNDSMRMLVFKFSKNEKNDKKKIENIAQIMGNYEAPELKKQDNSYGELKAEDQSSQAVSQPNKEVKKESNKKVDFGEQDNQAPPHLPLILNRPPSTAPHIQNQQLQSNGSPLKKASKQSQKEQQVYEQSDKQSSKKSSSKQSKQQPLTHEEDSGSEELKELDVSAIETPRLDISGIKLESAQKEKQSFLDELKKQSFIVSESSTQKMEAKESINIGEKQKEEKRSFDLMQQQYKQSSIASSQQEPDKMVKLTKINNLDRKLLGDDEEPQEMSRMTEEDKASNNADHEDNDGSSHSKSKKSKHSAKSKSKSKATSQKDDSVYDSEEDEEDYSGGDNSDDQIRQSSGRKSGGSTGKQSKGSKGANERQPLLAPQLNNQSSAGRTYNPTAGAAMVDAPNMNDFKRGFGGDEEDKDDAHNNAKTSSHHSSKQQLNSTNANIVRQMNADPKESKAAFKKMEILKRDTQKIKTNPKYKCLDELSQDGHDNAQKNINDDPQALSSKELDFRETILKHEKRRKRKERKQKEKEQRKIKALNGEDTPTSLSASSIDTGTKGGDDEEVESSSSSDSSEDTKDEEKAAVTKDATPAGAKQAAQVATKKLQQRSNQDDCEISSVTTRQNKTERNHYILRMAIDEKYIPSSIQNLRLAAQFIFLILLLLSVTYYVIQNSLFDKINQNIKNIHNSESRLNHIIDITLRTRTLILMNKEYLNLTADQRVELLNTTIRELRNSATQLKTAQTDLSQKTATIQSVQLQKINPDDVVMQYKKYPNMPDSYIFSIWEAIMEIVVSAYRTSTLPLNEIVDDHPTTYFIIQNCLNSVLKALKSSTDAIIEESETNRQFNMQIFLYLLIAASCSLFISLIFLIPVINKVKRNKQEVLELFTHKNIEKHIDDQLKICRNFVSMRLQQENQGGPEQDLDGEENNINNNDKDLQNELNNNKYMKRIKKKNKGKKWKKLNTDFGSTLLKFLLFICIIQGYFLANYLLSSQFLSEVQDLTQELKLLISRELIYTNGTALIEGEPSITYVPRYHEQLYDEEEQLLDKFSQNYDYHSTSYNDDFNNIIYSNVCQYVGYDSLSTCESFNQGILKKGIYSSVIKYWDFLRQLNHDYLESSRNNQTIKQFLNEQRLQIAERMQDYYFKVALTKLVSKLEEDIDYFFNIEYIQNRTIFIIYIIYIVILYFLIWRKFVSLMQNELWKTKSMLSILPTKICFEIEEIRYFIYGNSSNDFLSTKL